MLVFQATDAAADGTPRGGAANDDAGARLAVQTGPARPPAARTSMVDRAAEVAQVRERLLDRHVRLLTLTGPGGVGKTRLGLQVAAEAFPAFGGEVYFVPLASVCTPDEVPAAIARALDPTVETAWEV